MTRRDYDLLNAALRKAKPDSGDYQTAQLWGWERAVREVASALAQRSVKFDQPRFMRDCGVS